MSQPQTTEPEWEIPDNAYRLLFTPARTKVGFGGRGGTKSWSFARSLLIQGWQNPLRIGCFREVQRSIKDSVHQLLADQIQYMGFGAFYDVLTNEIRGKNGSKFLFAGLSSLTAESIKSFEGIDRAWVEEAAAVTRRSWDILIPTIRKPDSEIWVSFNPELDTDETWVRYIENTPESCLVEEMSYNTNPWFPAVLEAERQEFLRQVEKGSRSQEDYDNIWGGKCKTAVDGAIYPNEVAAVIKSKRLCPVEYDPTLMVHSVWDIGWNDKMAIGFVQVAAGTVRLIDYIEDSHRTYDSYVDQILDKPYAKRVKTIWLPHDAKAANPQTGKSSVEIVKALVKTTSMTVDTVPDIGVKPGIEAARQMFSRVYFDKIRCTPLFNRLRRYARVVSPTTNEPGKPKHDENSHGADMFRYIAVVERELKNEAEDFAPIQYDSRGIV